ncbi:MAG: hypothetical protein A2745_02655 [Candidatus Harrisonbacteria bacterium RIFCSPHIGHO2_01_FULL_44_13]|uniref:Glutamyl-tRNA amidotransferase n=1 Tax=Candidatus Harrisonbacteria bacterium RIFCSPLOWO2_01_FULL_44_18 TaxID=1798407 RepID=A0A1G1ZP51_9BACT|nr:MAG: hypothetical protein A2745_02655 [Candidatus Harrisonbacteria bacterium RIFCSPHIGHO2_01_FULL_44_13]OGY66291.1 MAG: hypothetical protein A3A16_00055 [Candidatus Harrisonbacteria bacterium RIFCSPLOWO2_01_FULL_44_18]
MPLKAQFNSDLKSAMKDGEQLKVSVLRLILTAAHNKEIEKRTKGAAAELTDEEFQEVLSREAKKRKEAIVVYEKGGRQDLADKEKKEFEIIQKYLPTQFGREEVEKIVSQVLARVEIKEFGPAMKEVMKELKGKADAALVSEIVKARLER